jgi:hypothetical protein
MRAISKPTNWRVFTISSAVVLPDAQKPITPGSGPRRKPIIFGVAQEVLNGKLVRLPKGIDKGAQLDWSGSSLQEIGALAGPAEGGSQSSCILCLF